MALGVEGPEQQKHAQDEAEVTDSIDDEGFVAGAGIIVIGIPKPDQSVRAQADSFPTDEKQQQTIAQHQGQHRRGEQVEISEETPEGIVVVHVAGGVNMDETSYAGNNEDHHCRQRIHHKSHVDFQRAKIHPAIKVVDEKTLFRFETFEHQESVQREAEGNDNGSASDKADRLLAQALLDFCAEQAVNNCAEQRQKNDPTNKIALYRIFHLTKNSRKPEPHFG